MDSDLSISKDKFYGLILLFQPLQLSTGSRLEASGAQLQDMNLSEMQQSSVTWEIKCKCGPWLKRILVLNRVLVAMRPVPLQDAGCSSLARDSPCPGAMATAPSPQQLSHCTANTERLTTPTLNRM
ncbi:hypothetical protein AV530_015258 [Patagioenas fasciata monilis]|uniref:Uncharacterized protein n=1 Tax=Patagioenas fasciata monilis TaxID=372326 RepID=A0A1V4K1Q5_PATFA|nr:hypothetical protein AV530_015258 [Patagioenas fasciata monilis]